MDEMNHSPLEQEPQNSQPNPPNPTKPFPTKLVVILATIGVIAIVVLVALLILSKPSCSHQWIEADCLYPKTCRICQATEGVANGHDFIDATCTAPKTCQVCQLTEGVSLGHDIVVDDAAPATCTTEGLTEGKHCDRCNEILVLQVVTNKLGHSFSQWETLNSASCLSNGTKKRVCLLCNHTETQTISAIGHTIVTDKSVSATCTQSGLTEGSHCSKCKTVLVHQNVIPQKAHNVKNGTCTECHSVIDAYNALACYVWENGTYNGEGWYFIEHETPYDGNEYDFYIFTDDTATSLSFVLYSYVSNSDSYIEIYLDKNTDILDVYMENESSGHTTYAYGSIYKDTYGYSNYIYDYEYYGDYSSLSSKFKEVFQTQVDLLLTGVKSFLLPDYISMEMLGFYYYD